MSPLSCHLDKNLDEKAGTHEDRDGREPRVSELLAFQQDAGRGSSTHGLPVHISQDFIFSPCVLCAVSPNQNCCSKTRHGAIWK